MASNKREEEFMNNHKRYVSNQKGFRFAFWASLIPSGGVFAIMTLIYMLKGLALLAGARLVIAQSIVNREMGTNESSGLTYSVPYGFMGFLAAIAILTCVRHFFGVKKANGALLALYLAEAAYGIFGLATGACGVLMGLYLLALGGYGVWLSDYTRRLNKELDYLALQEGYPDFIEAINEPKAIANTSGLSSGRSDYQKRLRQEGGSIEKPLPIMTEQQTSMEMDELSVDMQLPKGNRKIDNMM